MFQTGIYKHFKTGKLYFVNEDVDCFGMAEGDVPGVSYYRLYEPGKKCIRSVENFFSIIDAHGGKQQRFSLLKELPPSFLKNMLPGAQVYIPERCTVRYSFLQSGNVFVGLVDRTGKKIIDIELEVFLRNWVTLTNSISS